MITLTQLYQGAQEVTGDTDTGTIAYFKRAINVGMQKYMAIMRRYWTRASKVADLVASQQYYQFPQDAIRITGVVVTSGGISYPLEPVTSEMQWRRLNIQTAGTVVIPTYYFVRGQDEIGLWPTPSTATSSGLEIYYEPKVVNLTQDDYTTGTVTVTNGSQTITHSGTGFTAKMVGRYFQTTDNSDGLWYKVTAYIDTSNLTLENYYQGISGAGTTFLIGECPPFPEEYHESLIDYAAYRYFLDRKDIGVASEYKALFDAAVAQCRETYASKITSSIITNAFDDDVWSPWGLPPTSIS